MAFKFNNDHQPEASEFDENYSDPRELRRARIFWPDAKPREWRNAPIPPSLRGNLVKRLLGKLKAS